MSGWYFESWLDNPYSCLLFTVSSISEKSAVLLDEAVLFLIPGIWQGKFFWISILNSIFVSGSLLHIMKLWVNLKSVNLSWSVVIPNAIIGDPSAVFNLVMVASICVLKLLSIVWYVEYLVRDMATPKSKEPCNVFLHVPLLWDNLWWVPLSLGCLKVAFSVHGSNY